jgi:CheY-like chemotaxis protein
MSRILLADDSPHAQRMGERILREEGFEVVTVTDGETALIRLADVDPDIILADVYLPGRSGYDLCRHIKGNPRLRHTQVVLTAGLLEPFDEMEAQRANCDGVLRKPFEASVVLSTVEPLAKAAETARTLLAGQPAAAVGMPEVRSNAPVAAAVAVALDPSSGIDSERVRAAVTLALDAAMPKLIDEITERVLTALGH